METKSLGPGLVSLGSLIAVALAATPASDAGQSPEATSPVAPTQGASQPVQNMPVTAQPGDTGVTSYPASFFAGSQPNTALDMVNNLPGFSLDIGDSVRGFGGAAGNVLIDGERPASKNDGLDQILQRIPASAVLRIDLIRGGAPGIDMQGKTMIANVVRKAGGGLHVVAAVQGTADSNGKKDWGLRLEGSREIGKTSFEAGILMGRGADDGTGDGPRIITDAQGHITQTGYEHYFGDGGQDKANAAVETPLLGGRLRVEGSFLHNPYYSTNADQLIQPPGFEDETYWQNQNTGEMGVRYTRPLGHDGSLELYALQQLGLYASSDIFLTDTDDTLFTLGKRTGESIVRGVYKRTLSPTLSVEAGGEVDYNWLTSHTFESDNGAPEFVPAANVHVTEKRGEAFADGTWQATPKLTVEGGIRVETSQIASTGDVVSTESFTYPKPRGVITWSPDPSDQLQLRLEREVSQLDFGYFTASGTLGAGEHAGNPTLTPDQDWVIEAAYDRHFWKGGDINITVRRYWITDVIDYAPSCDPADILPGPPPICDPADVFDNPANIGSGWRDELATTLTLPTDRIGLPNGLITLHATWRLAQVIDPSTHQPREASGLHRFDGDLHFQQGLPKWHSNWGWDFQAPWSATNFLVEEVDNIRLGPWFDVYYEYHFSPTLGLKFEADNLLSHGLTQIRNFYDPYRDVPGGGVLSSIDGRYPRFGPEFSFRLRKTFG